MSPVCLIQTVKGHLFYTVQNYLGEKTFPEKSLGSLNGKKIKT